MEKLILNVETDATGRFVERVNRFLGIVDIEFPDGFGKEEVHVRDPGRLNEILYEGNTVALKRASNGDRRTDWDLIAGRVGNDWVFVNSGYHRKIAETVLRDDGISPYKNIDLLIPEKELGESRIDFLLERGGDKVWVEVKGCTLAGEGVALFPDSPTKRGKRHVEELEKVLEVGDSAGLIILVFRPDAEFFRPNRDTDPEFADAFERAREKGLEVHPVKFKFEDDGLYYLGEIPLW